MTYQPLDEGVLLRGVVCLSNTEGAAVRRTALLRTTGLVAGLVLVMATQVGTAAAAGKTTCKGGSVAAGSYSSLRITGTCMVDSGNVTVRHSVVVASHATLLAAFGGSTLTIRQNLKVHSGAIVVLGCEASEFPCLNDNQMAPTMSTHQTVRGNVTATGALMMLFHNDTVGRNVTQTGGGGGVTCNLFPLGPDGPPAYSTYEDSTIGRNLTITGVRSCWMGVIRNTVGRNVNYNHNVLADPDGNEVVTNTIGRNLNCTGNNPAPQFGDSMGNLNHAGGRGTGQCVKLVA